jgi:hypothetical protein
MTRHSRVLLVVLIGLLAGLTAWAEVQGDWKTQASQLRGKNGQRFTFVFPAGGTLGSVWGTDLYTDDSSVATAAVHAGLITADKGGKVTIEIRPGAASYAGSTRHGVTSSGYGSFGGSFVFVTNSAGGAAKTTQGDWRTSAGSLRGMNGQRFTYFFPANGTLGSVWGTDLYTDDSSIATAAVHAGFITADKGGTVTIEIRAGADSYKGSTRNGVKSSDYGSFGGSFVFVSGSAQESREVVSDWRANASAWRGKNGQRFTYTFPAGGTPGSVWGTDLYTDDSSVATAAVHAGLITFAKGGKVTIEIRAGAAAYAGSTRNGVTSSNYGSFGGSFVFIPPPKK